MTTTSGGVRLPTVVALGTASPVCILESLYVCFYLQNNLYKICKNENKTICIHLFNRTDEGNPDSHLQSCPSDICLMVLTWECNG